MLSEKYIRKTLEEVITSKDYIEAKDIKSLRVAVFDFLKRLETNKIFKFRIKK